MSNENQFARIKVVKSNTNDLDLLKRLTIERISIIEVIALRNYNHNKSPYPAAE
jgi:hypothetical protein